jgi:glycerophosphoryl diester phosphodiesterase
MRWLFGLFFCLSMTACQDSRKPSWEGFDLQGHRGCRGLMPENSVEGMKQALELGVKTLEMDVVVTADRKLILSHEPYISAEICLDPSGNEIHPEEQYELNIFQMNLDEIQSFDCGSKVHPRFPQQKKFPSKKPLLSEVVLKSDAYAIELGRRLPIYNIETKLSPFGDERYHPLPLEFAELLNDEIMKLDIEDRCTVQSFDPRSLIAIHDLNPDIRLVLLFEGTSNYQASINEIPFVPYAFSPDHELLSKEMIDWTQEKGMKVIPWTVNDSERALQLIEWGVDGIITDYPDRVKSPNAID